MSEHENGTRDETLRKIVLANRVAIESDVANAKVAFRVHGTGDDQVATTVRTARHTATVDEPDALGGRDTAPNPVEYALAALASCQVVTYRFWAAKLGIQLDEVQVDAEGDLDLRGFFGLDGSIRSGFTEVRLQVTLDGPEAPQRYADLQQAVDDHCPVLDLFGHATPVRTELKVPQDGRAAA